MISPEVRALFARLHDEPRRIVFPGLLPSRNELDAAQRKTIRVDGYPRNLYVHLKRLHQNTLQLWAQRYRFEPARGKVIVACNWREETRHRDPDNIISGGRKLLLDAIGPGRKGEKGWTGAGLMHCDGWHCIAGFVDVVTLAPDAPGVEVVVAEVQLELPLSRAVRDVVVDARP